MTQGCQAMVRQEGSGWEDSDSVLTVSTELEEGLVKEIHEGADSWPPRLWVREKEAPSCFESMPVTPRHGSMCL